MADSGRRTVERPEESIRLNVTNTTKESEQSEDPESELPQQQQTAEPEEATTTTTANTDWIVQRDEWKLLGDTAYRQHDFATAIEHYTSALSLDPDHGILLSNRSAAHLQHGYKSAALHDAVACVATGTTGTKGLSRQAAALQSLGRYRAAWTVWQSILLGNETHQQPTINSNNEITTTIRNDPSKQHPPQPSAASSSASAAALAGIEICERQLLLEHEEKQKQRLRQLQKEDAEEKGENFDPYATNGNDTIAPEATTITMNTDNTETGDAGDDMDDFFDDVEEATVAVRQDKLAAAVEAAPVPTDAVKNHKRDLGTTREQIARLIPNKNYLWYNLNPFAVLDLPHTTTKEEISRRFKALSLLLHPDKNAASLLVNKDSSSNTNNEGEALAADQLQLAYDQVLIAKAALLNDDDRLKHTRDLVEQGMRQGIVDRKAALAKLDTSNVGSSTTEAVAPLEDYQRKAVQRLFADLEHARRQVAERERSFHQREQATEDAVATKERNERSFDKQWKKEERVDKRIGDWRDFQKKKKKST